MSRDCCSQNEFEVELVSSKMFRYTTEAVRLAPVNRFLSSQPG